MPCRYLLPICLGVQLSLRLRKVQIWVIRASRQARVVKGCADQQAQFVAPTDGSRLDGALSGAFIFHNIDLKCVTVVKDASSVCMMQPVCVSLTVSRPAF